jgi:hypothetical protein
VATAALFRHQKLRNDLRVWKRGNAGSTTSQPMLTGTFPEVAALLVGIIPAGRDGEVVQGAIVILGNVLTLPSTSVMR